MDGVRVLSHEEAEKYLNYVSRLGKARAIPSDQREKYKHAYSEVISYLNENFKGFLLYCINGEKEMVSRSAVAAMSEQAYKVGLFDRIRESLSAGNTEEFRFLCKSLELLYKYYEHEGRKARKAIRDMQRVS